MPGPALVDLRFIYQTSIKNVSLLASFRALGYLLGTFVPLLTRYFNRQLLIALGLTLQSISLAVTPHLGKLYLLYLMGGVYGFGGVIFDSSFNYLLVQMWGEKSEPFLQMSQLAYGIGLIASPAIGSSFVYGETLVTNSTNGILTNITVEMREQSLTIPFSIGGVIQFLGEILICIFSK